jgi:hypothetical protein
MIFGLLNAVFGVRKTIQVCTKEFDAIIAHQKKYGSHPPYIGGNKGARTWSTEEYIYEENTSMTKFRHEIERDRERGVVEKPQQEEKPVEQPAKVHVPEENPIEASIKRLGAFGEVIDRYGVIVVMDDEEDGIIKPNAIKYKVKGLVNLMHFVRLTEEASGSPSNAVKETIQERVKFTGLKPDAEFEVTVLHDRVFAIRFYGIDRQGNPKPVDHFFVLA